MRIPNQQIARKGRQYRKDVCLNGCIQQSDRMPKDDEIFRSLSTSDQRHVLDVYALTNEDSVWRCYGAVRFLRALDPQLLSAISRLVDQPPSGSTGNPAAHAAHTTR